MYQVKAIKAALAAIRELSLTTCGTFKNKPIGEPQVILKFNAIGFLISLDGSNYSLQTQILQLGCARLFADPVAVSLNVFKSAINAASSKEIDIVLTGDSLRVGGVIIACRAAVVSERWLSDNSWVNPTYEREYTESEFCAFVDGLTPYVGSDELRPHFMNYIDAPNFGVWATNANAMRIYQPSTPTPYNEPLLLPAIATRAIAAFCDAKNKTAKVLARWYKRGTADMELVLICHNAGLSVSIKGENGAKLLQKNGMLDAFRNRGEGYADTLLNAKDLAGALGIFVKQKTNFVCLCFDGEYATINTKDGEIGASLPCAYGSTAEPYAIYFDAAKMVNCIKAGEVTAIKICPSDSTQYIYFVYADGSDGLLMPTQPF